MNGFNIGETMTIRLTKRDLIDLINKTFPDDNDNIAVITQLTTRDYETGDKAIAQSIVFGRLLEV